MSEINEFLAVKTKDLQTVTTEGEEFVLVTQKGRTRNAKIKDVRHVADDLDDEDITKAASNLNLKKEKERAIESEDNLNEKIDTEINRSKEAESNLDKKLDDEIKRSISSENILNNNIIVERDRAKNAEKVITDDLEKEVNRANNAESILTKNLATEVNRATSAEQTLANTINTNKPIWDDKYTKNEIDNKISQVITDLDWKESVETFSNLATTYPDPDDGWTVNVKDTDITYRWSGSEWIAISANSIPLATSTTDGKMSKEDKVNLDDVNAKKHTHDNKSILDTITQTLINNWNSAFTHISDAVKHITSAERTLWNTVSNKLNLSGGTLTGKLTITGTAESKPLNVRGINGISTDGTTDDALYLNYGTTNPVYVNGSNAVYHGGNKPTKSDVGLGNVDNTSDLNKPISTAVQTALNGKANSSHTHDDRYYTESECNSKFATKDELSASGNGDMLKSVYDTNNSGVVDKAEKLATARTINGVAFDGSSNITISDSTKLPLSGGTVTGRTIFNEGISVKSMNAGQGTTGYMYIAQIKISRANQNQPIIFDIQQRDRYGTIIIQFVNASSNDPELRYINKIGNITAYIYKSAASTWDLYIQKSEAYDVIDVIGFGRGEYMAYLSVTWQNATVTLLPSGYITASNATIDMNVTNSTKATQDSDGNQINTTYVKKGSTWGDLLNK